MKRFQLFLKRAFDIFAGSLLVLMLIIIPVFIVVPIIIRATSKGPAIFTQERRGKNEEIFKIYKYRTMRIPEESLNENGEMLEPKQRITKIGKFLRKTSIDELTQIFNVIKGDMSFVGPRPALPYQIERYTEEQKRRHAMRPGITGLAQVSGRNNLSWTEKIEYDIKYIDNFSVWLDIKILFKTLLVTLKSEGIEFTKQDVITAKETEKETVTQ